jgi:hypothetical protein
MPHSMALAQHHIVGPRFSDGSWEREVLARMVKMDTDCKFMVGFWCDRRLLISMG